MPVSRQRPVLSKAHEVLIAGVSKTLVDVVLVNSARFRKRASVRRVTPNGTCAKLAESSAEAVRHSTCQISTTPRRSLPETHGEPPSGLVLARNVSYSQDTRRNTQGAIPGSHFFEKANLWQQGGSTRGVRVPELVVGSEGSLL
jgi:hypothetical protein